MGISIIIPTLNEERYIIGTLESLAKQVSKDDEVIIIDSYSTDNTIKLAKKYGTKVYLVPRGGIGPAKTFGARKAGNEIVAFLDADGVPDTNWISRIRECFSNGGTDAVGGVDFYSSSSIIREIIYNLYSVLVFLTGINYYKITGYPWMPWNNCAIRRKLFLEKGGLRNVVCEDYDFAQRAKGINMVYDCRMRVFLSDRRFSKEGFLRTVWLWIKSDLAILRDRNIMESTSYKLVR